MNKRRTSAPMGRAPTGRGKRENRRKARHGGTRFAWYVGAVLLVGGAGSLVETGWSHLTWYAAHHPYFTASEIVIDAGERFSAEEVQMWAGLTPGMNLWDIDPAQVETRLLAQPWVRTAQVRREFPQRVHIAVSARQPVAIVRGDPFLYLDESGACFALERGDDPLDLPYVGGLTGLSLDSPTARTALAGIVQMLSLARLWPDGVSEIHWDQQQGYTLFLARRRATVHLGWETAPENFAHVGKVLDGWPVDGPPTLFDARFANQVVARPYIETAGKGSQRPTRRL